MFMSFYQNPGKFNCWLVFGYWMKKRLGIADTQLPLRTFYISKRWELSSIHKTEMGNSGVVVTVYWNKIKIITILLMVRQDTERLLKYQRGLW